MSERADVEWIGDIQEAIQRISIYVGDLSYEAFSKDIKTQDAVIRNIEVIGEAAKGVSEKLRVESADIPWTSMAGMRDRLIHRYFGVNLDIVWEVVSLELPLLAAQVERVMENCGDGLHENGDFTKA
ncbi:MAG TPA: DUF86 domain-containing protein [Candidatus Accumulibacter phosphatis]|nr:hypothetical protein [Accumulibacter sp.]HCN69308.1 hypothetical protein [Accumulibacter sp.]HRL75339.1 DUF86 domain-containing protein [Candidatus Accumulibacter phosphatis]HRQ95873.1 DUF86 domain-containing protein [Candidatus Accumulibacter phosphatis]